MYLKKMGTEYIITQADTNKNKSCDCLGLFKIKASIKEERESLVKIQMVLFPFTSKNFFKKMFLPWMKNNKE